MNRLSLLIVLILLCAVGFSQTAIADESAPFFRPSAAQLAEGEWNQVALGGETICSRGTEYRFLVRPGDPQKLMIHFQGGGACWNGFNCPPSPFQTFDDSVSENEADGFTQGLFDAQNPENPVGDYTTVVVTYCSADIHVGDTVVQHDSTEIHHRGVKNATAVLDWVYDNYPNPDNVFVNGCSAGSYGSIFYAPQVAAQYPEASFAHLGDAGLGVLTPEFDGLVKWGFFDVLGDFFPTLADVTPQDFQINMLYAAALEAYPERTFSQYTTLNDEVQTAFYQLMGGKAEEWSPKGQGFLQELNDTYPNFASYTADGTLHCIIPRPELYDYEVGGVRLIDWVAALAAGEDLQTVALSQ